jgi:hypothetical protein
MVFAKELKWSVNWWIAFMNESVQALLSCRHSRYRAPFEQTEKSRTTTYIGLSELISIGDVMDGPSFLALRRLYCHSA